MEKLYDRTGLNCTIMRKIMLITAGVKRQNVIYGNRAI